jgi:hypothetical protein
VIWFTVVIDMIIGGDLVRLPAVGTLKRYSKALEYEYRVKTAALGTLKRYSIISLTLWLRSAGLISRLKKLLTDLM